jgi:rfaE bifunctional protein nucleotidyltransferase chain/domain
VNSRSKIVKVETLKQKVAALKKQGKTVAFTNGCFDIVHYGHVSYLETAKKKDRVLIIGLNSDKSIRRIKGKTRPIIKQDARAALLAALECVDFVTIFDDDTPLKVIEALKPDVLIKGADWKGKGVVGEKVVKLNGGKVEFVTYIKGHSTTNIINKVYQKCLT